MKRKENNVNTLHMKASFFQQNVRRMIHTSDFDGNVSVNLSGICFMIIRFASEKNYFYK